jgi:hypothetical protein
MDVILSDRVSFIGGGGGEKQSDEPLHIPICFSWADPRPWGRMESIYLDFNWTRASQIL